MKGFGIPIYTNIKHPFPAEPPNINRDNPTGSYRTGFDIPENWKEKQVYIHFEGVQSAFYIWLNGIRVGYSQGSMTAAEFDLRVSVRNAGMQRSSPKKINITLGNENRKILSHQLDVNQSLNFQQELTIQFQQEVIRPLLWSAEHPDETAQHQCSENIPLSQYSSLV